MKLCRYGSERKNKWTRKVRVTVCGLTGTTHPFLTALSGTLNCNPTIGLRNEEVRIFITIKYNYRYIYIIIIINIIVNSYSCSTLDQLKLKNSSPNRLQADDLFNYFLFRATSCMIYVIILFQSNKLYDLFDYFLFRATSCVIYLNISFSEQQVVAMSRKDGTWDDSFTFLKRPFACMCKERSCNFA